MDGTFFVAEVPPDNPKAPAWVPLLNVVYKKKPTRHLIKDNGDGILSVNKKIYGDHTTIQSLIQSVMKPDLPTGWPVQLTNAITASGTTAAVLEKESTAVDRHETIQMTAAAGSSLSIQTPAWYFPIVDGTELSRPEAEGAYGVSYGHLE